MEVPTTLDRSKGDIHALGNPHFMTDPVNAHHAAERICDAFSTLDQEHSAVYRQRLDAFNKRLDGKLVPCPRKPAQPFWSSLSIPAAFKARKPDTLK